MIIVATVAKWGNSLAVRIPQNLAKELELVEGTEIEYRCDRIISGSLNRIAIDEKSELSRIVQSFKDTEG